MLNKKKTTVIISIKNNNILFYNVEVQECDTK